MQKRSVFLFLLVLGTAFWGISFAFVKAGVSSGSPFVFLCYKFALATVVLAFLFASRLARVDRQSVVAGVWIGLPLFLGNVSQTLGLQNTSVANVAFITGLDVMLIPLIKSVIFRKAVRKRVWFACSIALTGLYLIVAQSGLHLNVGDLWAMACAVFFACYVLAVGHFAHRFDAMVTVTTSMAVCTIGSFSAALLDSRSIWMPSDLPFWQGVAFAALLGTAYMYGVQSVAQKYLEEERIALAFLLEPIFAAIAGLLILGEPVSLRTFAGGLLILFALTIEISPALVFQRLNGLGIIRSRV